MGSQTHGTGLEVKIEVVRTQLVALERTVCEARDETRHWRDEMKQETRVYRTDMTAVMSKHEETDNMHHATVLSRVDRMETQMLEGGKLVIGRIEGLERQSAARMAVTEDRKWLLGTVIIAAASLLLNAINIFRISASVGGAP